MLIGQSEFVVHSAVELMQVLGQQAGFTFSFPEEISKKTASSTLIEHPTTKEKVQAAFNKMGCDVLFLTDKHLLLRPSGKPMGDELSEIRIRDSKTGEALAWVALSDIKSQQVYFSDEKGVIYCKLGSGRMEISMMGYKSQTLESAKEQVMDVYLQADPVALNVVEKKGVPIALTPDGDKAVVNYTTPYALMTRGLGGIDVFAAVQSLPGVDAASESSGKISIRGSNADETLLVLDGLPIFNNSHYYDIFGTINPYFIQGFDLYKNSYPTEYSGRTGGMLALHSKSIIDERIKGTLDVNFLSASAMLMVPLHKNVSISGAIRNSFRNISNDNFYSINPFTIREFDTGNEADNLTNNTVVSSPEFSFGDHNIKLEFDNESTKFQISYNQIYDDFKNELNYEVAEPGRPLDRLLINHSIENTRSWESKTFGFTFSHIINPKASIFVSGYKAHFLDDYNMKIELRSDRPGGPRGSSGNSYISRVEKSGITAYTLYKIGQKIELKGGYDLEIIKNKNVLINPRKIPVLLGSNANIHNLFSELEYLAINGWRLNAGTRIAFTDKKGIYPSLQSGVYKNVGDKVQFRTILSYNYQLHRRIDIRDVFDQSLSLWSVVDDKIPTLSAASVSSGLSYKTASFLVDAELYYKKLNGVGEFANPQPGVRLEDEEAKALTLYSGQGQSFGMDMLARYETDRYSSQLSYSWSKLIYEIPGVFKGKPYFAPGDRRHQIKSYHAYRIGKLSMNAAWVFASGQPYLIGNKIGEGENIGNFNKEILLDRLPSYSRLDLGLNYGFDYKKTHHLFSLQLYNVANRQNIKMVHYLSQIRGIYNTKEEAIVTGTVTNMLNRTINLGWTLKF